MATTLDNGAALRQNSAIFAGAVIDAMSSTDRIANAKAILDNANKGGVSIFLPVDHVTASEFSETAAPKTTAAADIAIGVSDVQFALSEVKLGIIPAVISPYVIEAMGARYAHRYFITAERFSGSEAYRIGLLHDLAPSIDAMDEMIAGLCTVLLGNGPKAIEAAKNLIQAVAQKPIDDELMEDTIERIAQIRSTPEAKEGIGAFLAKRRPDWVKE